MRISIIFVLLISLSDCTAISNVADSIGSHMPTIGEPCNHWQCITDDGQKKSDEAKDEIKSDKKSQ